MGETAWSEKIFSTPEEYRMGLGFHRALLSRRISSISSAVFSSP